jgi:hypothetical protein
MLLLWVAVALDLYVDKSLMCLFSSKVKQVHMLVTPFTLNLKLASLPIHLHAGLPGRGHGPPVVDHKVQDPTPRPCGG